MSPSTIKNLVYVHSNDLHVRRFLAPPSFRLLQKQVSLIEMMHRLVFVSGNANKVKEVKAILSGISTVEVTNQAIDLPELQGTVEDVAREKCRIAVERCQGPGVITEDTALCFDAMGGLPGVYIKWFLEKLGHEGLNKMLDGFETRSAYALCTLAYAAAPGIEPILFQGRTDGAIVRPRTKAGKPLFGWDPIFEITSTGKTYAEMDDDQKNQISHRFKAFDKLKKHLAESNGS